MIAEEGGEYLSCEKESFKIGKEYETIVYSHYQKEILKINDEMIREVTSLENERANLLLIAGPVDKLKIRIG